VNIKSVCFPRGN